MDMSVNLDAIKNHALQLSMNDRFFLAQTLLESLDNSIGQPINYEKKWINEAKKRYKAFSQGTIKGIDENLVFQEAFERIQ